VEAAPDSAFDLERDSGCPPHFRSVSGFAGGVPGGSVVGGQQPTNRSRGDPTIDPHSHMIKNGNQVADPVNGYARRSVVGQ